jgi:sulfur-carrier protein
MARVVVGSECWPLTGGASTFDIPATTVRDLINALDAKFPGLGDLVDRRMAFAIDGVIHQDAWFADIGMDAEVVLIPKIGGG